MDNMVKASFHPWTPATSCDVRPARSNVAESWDAQRPGGGESLRKKAGNPWVLSCSERP